ncbi:MAG: TIGR04282 family arsenosugar biosynthesis glycosyltransferase [Solirubrobacterales bacterium]
MMLPRLLVIAKAPVPGRSKTRLSPPCSPDQAAVLAEAALVDTLEAVAMTDCGGRTLVLDGTPGDWLPEGFDVVPQVDGTFNERLAGAFSHHGDPALLIGMDTPQVDPGLLAASLERLQDADVDAVLGHCPDGGYWTIGMTRPHPGAFESVPMSTGRTGVVQESRLRELGMSVEILPELGDIDYFEDARRVADQWPDGHFASAMRDMEANLCRK